MEKLKFQDLGAKVNIAILIILVIVTSIIRILDTIIVEIITKYALEY